MYSKNKEVDDGPAELESQFILRLPVVRENYFSKNFISPRYFIYFLKF